LFYLKGVQQNTPHDSDEYKKPSVAELLQSAQPSSNKRNRANIFTARFRLQRKTVQNIGYIAKDYILIMA
jgi:hypothetical protein